ncbi:Deoxyguanosine kinase [Jeotgalicoccus aerolatus]|uniref:Deoxyadenosine/deoxycytidine kinase n=1 Tax=Jeotgalicoccus aerolatus TaxID=709510 RepID=A0A1G9CXE7_9STAP|nr:deoxynucleoside kinase [Jeotgalicoccus aerolatus]MBP1952643.1 deoxyadenosine/deoxycytidine kinase [Jeotgalicoccus aerolatus]CAD2074119.1 Deoxyguanosine kinase [Jeotgalicoccus aerolatus]SDK56094.1 Deoxyadenosine/deoxycytidine kinase [Jeotgalicoccus aerolatus]HJG32378.1 deoxynucleoside kinase [Jeotgalicoccus aerolatus]
MNHGKGEGILITLAGTIGAGKTEWGKVIAKHFDVDLLEEKVDGNPFLEKYYDEPERYSFHLQVFFLNHRFKAIKSAMAHPNSVLDRSIYEDAMIFARLQYENGSMDKAEYETYLDLHENMMQELNDLYKQQVLFKKSPDLMVMVHGSFDEVMRRIKKRGRDFEQIDGNPELYKYYQDLYDMYENEFVPEYINKGISPVYVIDIDKMDLYNPEHVNEVLGGIEETLKNDRGFVYPEEIE